MGFIMDEEEYEYYDEEEMSEFDRLYEFFSNCCTVVFYVAAFCCMLKYLWS